MGSSSSGKLRGKCGLCLLLSEKKSADTEGQCQDLSGGERERGVCVYVRGKASVGNMPSVRDRKEGQLLYASEREVEWAVV